MAEADKKDLVLQLADWDPVRKLKVRVDAVNSHWYMFELALVSSSFLLFTLSTEYFARKGIPSMAVPANCYSAVAKPGLGPGMTAREDNTSEKYACTFCTLLSRCRSLPPPGSCSILLGYTAPSFPPPVLPGLPKDAFFSIS